MIPNDTKRELIAGADALADQHGQEMLDEEARNERDYPPGADLSFAFKEKLRARCAEGITQQTELTFAIQLAVNWLDLGDPGQAKVTLLQALGRRQCQFPKPSIRDAVDEVEEQARQKVPRE